MVVLSFFAKLRGIVGLTAAISGLAIATPAAANSAAANADVAAPLRAAQAARPSPQGGDEEFNRLFTGWKSADNGTFALPVATPIGAAGATPSYLPRSVSIPSRMPVNNATLTSGFGLRWHPVIGGRRQHKGVDLAAPTGTPIHASADGTVAMAERYSGYGLYVQIEHGGSLETRYGHMSRIAVAEGQYVHKGDVIGYVGSTGRSTGPHLHYEVRVDGAAVNPIPYMHGGELPTGEDTVLASR